MKKSSESAGGGAPRPPQEADGSFWVYIVRCADATLYTGVARNVEKRIAEHNGAGTRGARYTSARRPVALVYQAQFANRSQAQQEEARIKSLSRAEKQILIAPQRNAGRRSARPKPARESVDA